MNIKTQLESLFNQTHLSIAKITKDKGKGLYEAQNESGLYVILKGSADVGKKYFYDMHTRIIMTEAPDIEFTDISV